MVTIRAIINLIENRALSTYSDATFTFPNDMLEVERHNVIRYLSNIGYEVSRSNRNYGVINIFWWNENSEA